MQDDGIFVGHIPSDGVGGAPPLVHYNNVRVKPRRLYSFSATVHRERLGKLICERVQSRYKVGSNLQRVANDGHSGLGSCNVDGLTFEVSVTNNATAVRCLDGSIAVDDNVYVSGEGVVA